MQPKLSEVVLGRTCTRCDIYKSLDEFHKQNDGQYGRQSRCKDCRNHVARVDYSPRYKDKATKAKRAYHLKDPRRRMVDKAKERAKLKGVPFDLKYTDFEIPEYCPLLGIKLEWNTGNPGKKGPGPGSPSLDRIVPSKGYVKGNVWVISTRANTIKNDATPEELLLIAKSLAAHLGKPIH